MREAVLGVQTSGVAHAAVLGTAAVQPSDASSGVCSVASGEGALCHRWDRVQTIASACGASDGNGASDGIVVGSAA